MSAIKKESAKPNPRSKRPRAVHSEFLKRFHGETSPAESKPRHADPAIKTPAEFSDSEPELEVKPGLRVLNRERASFSLMQTLVQRRNPGEPLLEVELKLTTAERGSRQTDGLTEKAYLFRLEMVKTSAGIQLEGFSLGPWRAEGLDLEGGNLFVAEPLWTGFKSVTGKIRGRIRFVDTLRQCVLDLPWNTEALVPGPEPW